MNRMLIGLGNVALLLAGCGRRGPDDAALGPRGAPPRTVRLSSAAFAEGAPIPRLHTCDGLNASPPLAWSNVPKAAKSLALLCEDPDAPGGTFTHWVVYSLPPGTAKLEQGVADRERIPARPEGVASQGKNDFGRIGFGGPCPPSGTHRYVFRLFAVDRPLELAPGANRAQLLQALRGHVLAEGRLTGRYARSR